MTKTSPRCRHTARRPFFGMTVVDRDDDFAVFTCANCGARYAAATCIVLLPTGERCTSVAVTGHTKCRVHNEA